MKKATLLFVFFLVSCRSIFPSPPMTVIVEDFPTPIATAVIEPRPAIITPEKMQEARLFQLKLVTWIAAGDSAGIAEAVKYPITVNLDGPVAIASADEFERSYDRIFNSKVIDAVTQTTEVELLLLPEGIRVGQGEVWFNLYCMDLSCGVTQFFITRINN